jgi:diadenylate cyclase
MSDETFLNFKSFWMALRAYAWWQIAIELFLIGFAVYWVIRFLRGTRGARMLKGVGFVLITLYLIVSILGNWLTHIVFLYKQFLIFASVATVVVFQPELRRALMRLGETRLFRAWSNQLHEDIEALIEAILFLSKRKIGALVAIERDIGLGGIAESGTRINADLSASLLETIFWPNSPLHDLGVIVSQGKIAYAGVQFPLAESGELERELGSRHRAAVGMSQESDAVVLVVSEETGDVSIAERGRLTRRVTTDQLRRLLMEMLGSEGLAAAREAADNAEVSPAPQSTASGVFASSPSHRINP